MGECNKLMITMLKLLVVIIIIYINVIDLNLHLTLILEFHEKKYEVIKPFLQKKTV